MARIDNGIDVSLLRKKRTVIVNDENEKEVLITTKSLSDQRSFWTVLGLTFAGFFIGQFVVSFIVIALAFIHGMPVDAFTNPHLVYDYVSLSELLISQSFYTIIFTILTPWFYMKKLANRSLSELTVERKVTLTPLVLTILASVSLIFVNSYIVEWNANIDLPDFMSGFEEWAKKMEEAMEETTELFTTFNNFGTFLMAFVVVAIIPGIGEELLFRGLLQNSLHRWSKNTHVAVWVAAFLFSAIHLQFYGLFPRMVLGAMFGYLYVWSGNLWYPIAAHITNNGLSLIVAYLYQLGIMEINPDEPDTLPIEITLGALIVGSVLLYMFRNHYLKPKSLT